MPAKPEFCACRHSSIIFDAEHDVWVDQPADDEMSLRGSGEKLPVSHENSGTNLTSGSHQTARTANWSFHQTNKI